jgi:ATP-dependent helicase HrpA
MTFSPQTVLSGLDHVATKDRWPLLRDALQLQKTSGLADEPNPALVRLEKRYQASRQWVENRIRQQIPVNIDQNLPIGERTDLISKAIADHQVVILTGETGSGKTTQLPKMCMALGRGARGVIGHTQPRRLAARAVASRIAEEMQVPLGGLVGCQVRFHDQAQESTQIKLMTDGILLAEIQRDRFLTHYDTLIIDEAHERTLNIDFLLGYVKKILPKRPDLKVIVTSATIDVEKFSKHFNNAPIIEVSGRSYPVDIIYREWGDDSDNDEKDGNLPETIVAVTEEILALEAKGHTPQRGGDFLVFLPGEREIRDVALALRRSSIPHLDVVPLYARLSAAEQHKVFAPHQGRRIVLSTNVAETSITVPGISYVIDPGLARISRYSYRSKVQRLPIEAISQASANQRAGRCGRVSHGLCIRLYSEIDFNARPVFTDAEILRTNLAAVILQLMYLKLGHTEDFPFIDPPDGRFIKDGYTLLSELSAVNTKGHITAIGQKLARLPIDLRLARMVLEADRHNSLQEVLVIVSGLAIQDPRERPQEKQQQAQQRHAVDIDPDSDFITLLNLWNRYEEQRQALTQSALRKYCKDQFIHFMRMREWRDTHRQLRLACKELGLKEGQQPAGYAGVHKALLSGLLSHIALHKEARTYTAARGRQCIVHPSSPLAKKSRKWLVAAELVETSQVFARTVAKIDPEWIEPLAKHLVKTQYFDPHWEKKRAQVIADEQVSLYGLIVVGRRPVHFGTIDPVASRDIFIQSGLVERAFHTRQPFWKHNLQQIADIEALESKSRRRNILIEDSVLFAFYDRRIPEKIVNGAAFEQWLKDKVAQQSLFLHPDDLLQSDTSAITANQFPDVMEYQGMWFPLTYHFMPGAIDDGVSIGIPEEALTVIPEAHLAWLVPGMLREKCIAMIKALPKVLRKNFVPVPDFVDGALADLTPYQGSLTATLSEKLARMTGVRIAEDDWSAVVMDPHHEMNIKVLDANGQVVRQGRKQVELITGEATAPKLKLASKTQQPEPLLTQFPAAPIVEEDFITRAGIKIRVFPGLEQSEGGVRVGAFETETQAALAHEQALLWLLSREKNEACNYLLTQLKTLKTLELLYAPIGSTKEFREDIVLGALKWAYIAPWKDQNSGLPRSLADWDNLLQQGKAGFFDQGMRLGKLIHEILKYRTDIAKRISGRTSIQNAYMFADIKFQLDHLVFPGFASAVPMHWLEQYPRYCRGILARLDRSKGIPANEQWSIDQIKGYWDSLQKKQAQAVLQNRPLLELEQFRWMLEEYRISLFAQSLGTIKPVSAKRLDQWLAAISQ